MLLILVQNRTCRDLLAAALQDVGDLLMEPVHRLPVEARRGYVAAVLGERPERVGPRVRAARGGERRGDHGPRVLGREPRAVGVRERGEQLDRALVALKITRERVLDRRRETRVPG